MLGKFPEVSVLVSHSKDVKPVLCVSKASASNLWALPCTWVIAAYTGMGGVSFLIVGSTCLTETGLY